MIVVDANVVVGACLAPRGFEPFAQDELVAPPLMWGEAVSSVHEGMWRGELSPRLAETALAQIEGAPVAPRSPRRLRRRAWRIADDLGWARTYDAEYVALADLLGCALVTLDLRLRRGADRLGIVLTPQEYRRSVR